MRSQKNVGPDEGATAVERVGGRVARGFSNWSNWHRIIMSAVYRLPKVSYKAYKPVWWE